MTRWRRVAVALAVAGVSHGVLLWMMTGWLEQRDGARKMVVPSAVEQAANSVPLQSQQSASFVALIDEVPDGLVIDPVSGSHDAESEHTTHPVPNALADRPGLRAAGRGGGAPGGPDSWTGRRDRENYQTQPWNHPDRNRLPRRRSGRTRAAPESLVRAPKRGFDDRSHKRRRARRGHARAGSGQDRGERPGSAASLPDQPNWDEADPVFGGPRGARARQRVAGPTSPQVRVLADEGPSATEADRRGATSDTLDVAGASSQTRPAPIEMTRPQAGGSNRGVAGRSGQGVGQGGRGRGDAASTHDLTRGNAMPTVQARRQHPYFRRMYRRLDERIEFPRELALALRSGQVVVQFALAASGQISDLRVITRSGFAAFDRTVVEAFRDVAPFGPVPRAIMNGRPTIRVRAPYAFRNPIIR